MKATILLCDLCADQKDPTKQNQKKHAVTTLVLRDAHETKRKGSHRLDVCEEHKLSVIKAFLPPSAWNGSKGFMPQPAGLPTESRTRFDEAQIKKFEGLILKAMQPGKAYQRGDIAEATGLNFNRAAYYLKRLVEEKKLTRKGTFASTRYVK